MDGVNDMDYVGIGKRIRAQRYKLDLSQEELAEMAGISLVHMSHIETANTKLSLPVLVDLACALGVRTDDLIFDKEFLTNMFYYHLVSVVRFTRGRTQLDWRDILCIYNNHLCHCIYF